MLPHPSGVHPPDHLARPLLRFLLPRHTREVERFGSLHLHRELYRAGSKGSGTPRLGPQLHAEHTNTLTIAAAQSAADGI